MGHDKAFLKYKNKRFIDIAIDLINPFCNEIFISGNIQKYSEIGYKVVEDKYKNCGPVAGIYSVLSESVNDYCMILPVDMPFVSSELITHLVNNAHPDKISAIVLPNGHIEPLCAIYPNKIADDIFIFIERGNFKLINILETLKFKAIEINSSMDFYNEGLFVNVNTSEERTKLK